jgi:hypothetical protein
MMGGRMMGPGAMDMAQVHEQLFGSVASTLGMQPDELHDALTSGQTVADIARARGIDPDALADQLATSVMELHRDQVRAMIRGAMDYSMGQDR